MHRVAGDPVNRGASGSPEGDFQLLTRQLTPQAAWKVEGVDPPIEATRVAFAHALLPTEVARRTASPGRARCSVSPTHFIRGGQQ